jgi:hypothetical protein
LRTWAEKYRDKGLVVIGGHWPEFAFEKDVDNVRWAAKNLNVDYPIAIDSDHAVWRAFNNHYWPWSSYDRSGNRASTARFVRS